MSEWQSIETAPKDGTAILAWDGWDAQTVKWVCHQSDLWKDDWTLCVTGSYAVDGDVFDLTHWMPLPPPPTEQG